MAGPMLLVMVLALGQASVGAGDNELAREVSRLVGQLNDPRLEQRDVAEKALVALGPGVLEHLPRLDDDTPVGVQVRMGRVLKALASRITNQAAPAALVTLTGSMSLFEALAEVERQTGNRVALGTAKDCPVGVQCNQAPYWQAVDELLDQAHLMVDAYGGTEHALTLMPRPDGFEPRHGRADYCGQFRVEVSGVKSAGDFRRPGNDQLLIRMEVAWEPKLTPLFFSHPLSSIDATDEHGGRIQVAQPDGVRGAQALRGASSLEIFLPMQLPSRQVKQIATLKGSMTATVLSRIETFEFADLEGREHDQQRRAGVAVEVERVSKVDEGFEIYARMRFDQSTQATDTLQSYRMWVAKAEVFLVDPEGQRIDHFGYETTLDNGNDIGLAYTFDRKPDLEKCRLVLRIPTLTVDMPIDYELTNIGLP